MRFCNALNQTGGVYFLAVSYTIVVLIRTVVLLYTIVLQQYTRITLPLKVCLTKTALKTSDLQYRIQGAMFIAVLTFFPSRGGLLVILLMLLPLLLLWSGVFIPCPLRFVPLVVVSFIACSTQHPPPPRCSPMFIAFCLLAHSRLPRRTMLTNKTNHYRETHALRWISILVPLPGLRTLTDSQSVGVLDCLDAYFYLVYAQQSGESRECHNLLLSVLFQSTRGAVCVTELLYYFTACLDILHISSRTRHRSKT